ncbi:hypothetical protein GBF35_25850 [Nonomuraea phyllanthi]|uniref:hypothetical protein n=1 Tax=Nonomuraea phyllanthi TaxID=2219224 RepID=UPI0012939E5E|nr:hypothetical protein [Nonomuraea phyllanthi]QFY09621.1 hypothetical protein GBF35_25850 [Nonomuraea phyllanthi]
MSATITRWSFTATINDSDHLPEDVSYDEVTAEIEEVVTDALTAWYNERGHQLLACEPVVAW